MLVLPPAVWFTKTRASLPSEDWRDCVIFLSMDSARFGKVVTVLSVVGPQNSGDRISVLREQGVVGSDPSVCKVGALRLIAR